ncbi:unnamed protein product [Rhizoctonia solani]|uniref:Uncharacterized protein n=1 Tax=Rhizoctonia solani TaxID=456999 RepID=A0A8H3HGD7_9AGAM|nr:unnamed protein product [Rhizoctonia solani]
MIPGLDWSAVSSHPCNNPVDNTRIKMSGTSLIVWNRRPEKWTGFFAHILHSHRHQDRLFGYCSTCMIKTQCQPKTLFLTPHCLSTRAFCMLTTIEMGNTTQPMKKSTAIAKLPELSYELIAIIADFLFEFTPPNHTGNVENETICCVKPEWRHVVGFMAASPQLHRIGLERWVAVLAIRTAKDLEVALSFSQHIRELIFVDIAFSLLNNSALSRFPRVCTISVDCHEDVRPVSSVHRFTYRDIVTCLPKTLRHLEIKHAHGPDVNVIACVKRCCPNLESLWLGRCTAFNRIPACQFWESFPFEHDSYISCEGSASYAHSLGDELALLKNLRSLRLGIYLIPSTAILAHRCFHVHNQPAPPQINWQAALAPPPNAAAPQLQQQPPQVSDLIALLHQAPEEKECQWCREEFFVPSESTVTSTNRILKAAVPSLDYIEWMDWFTPKHLGILSSRA